MRKRNFAAIAIGAFMAFSMAGANAAIPTNISSGAFWRGEASSSDRFEALAASSFDPVVELIVIGFGDGATCEEWLNERACETYDRDETSRRRGDFSFADRHRLSFLFIGSVFGDVLAVILPHHPGKSGIVISGRDISEVPLPGGALLLLTGLVGLGVSAGRKRRA